MMAINLLLTRDFPDNLCPAPRTGERTCITCPFGFPANSCVNSGSRPSRLAARPTRREKTYVFFVSRKSGGSDRVKTTISSPVVVLMSWCRLNTLTAVIF